MRRRLGRQVRQSSAPRGLGSGWVTILGILPLLLLSLLSTAAPARGATANARVTTAQSSSMQSVSLANLGDSHELESFLDGVMPSLLAADHTPGATLAVVKDGQLLLAKGYGSADLAKGTPVQPDATTFRVGSVSKLFTWTAVMQLKEQGKLDLHTDVNRYLKAFQIPDTYPGHPITLTNLLTHTPGFEDHGMGTGVRVAGDLQPLGTWLANNIPSRVRPPGVVTSYSNYGAALAGYIVEQVSGQPFDDYVEQHILQPLKMSHSTFRQPVPQTLAAGVAQGYSYSGGTYTAQPFEYVAPWPAGSMSATATDMAAFMIAHLQNGAYGDARILQDATAQEMHTQHFANDPRVPGFDYGFYETRLAGQRIIGHAGDTVLFHSQLALLPERNVGVFVSVNGINGASAPAALVEAFVGRYFGGDSPALPTKALPGYADRAAKIAGSYWPTRHSYSTLEKFTMLVTTMSVAPSGNGHLSITTGQGDSALDVVEVAPWVFRQVRPQDFWMDVGTIVFQTDALGNVASVLLGNVPMMAWQRIAWYETPGFHFLVILACLLLFLATLILWPTRYLLSPTGRQRARAAAAWVSTRVTSTRRRKMPLATTAAREVAPVRVAGSVATGGAGTGSRDPLGGDSGGGRAVPEASPLETTAQPTREPSAVATGGRGDTRRSDPGTYSRPMLGGWRLNREDLGKLAHWLAAAASGLFLLFTIGFTIVFATQGERELVYGATPLLIADLLLGMLATILTLGVVACAFLVWRERVWNRSARVFYTLVALAAVAFVWELAFWNLLGVRV